jgi:hypothetical protein
MQNPIRRSRFAGIAAVILAVSVGGVAYAYFTSTGSGTGNGTVNSSSPWVLTSSAITGLGPGLAAQNIVGSATNTLGQKQYIGTVTPSVSSTSNVGCTSADFTLTNGTINSDTVSGATGLNFGTIAFNDRPGVNQNACEGVTVNLAFSSN